MKYELMLYLFLNIFIKIKAGYEIIIEEGEELERYNNEDYLRLFKIPNSMMTFKANGGEMSFHPLSNAFDENFATYWESIEHKTDTFSNAIEITFSKTITFNRVIFKAPTVNGFPIFFNFYCKLRKPDGSLSENDSDFLLIDTTAVVPVTNRIAYYLYDPATCDQIKLEWDMVDETKEEFPKATASEIMILIPETKELRKLLNLYSDNDYAQFTLNEEYSKSLFDLEQELQDYIYTYDHIKKIIDRAKKIVSGELKYNEKREFTTNQKAKGKMNIIHQYGDIRSYSRNTLKMARGGTNRQCTGIYGFSKDDIIIYVQSEDDSPLPSIRFSQYIGQINKFLSSPFKLKKGKNVIKIPTFDLSEIDVKVKSGGPIYIENPYTEDKQSQNIKIYIDNGILFPLFRKNDDEEEFKSILKQYLLEYNDNIDSYYNIVELYSDRIIITLNATFANEIYIINGESPQQNLVNWDKLMKYFYSFEGIKFEKNQPYYDPMNEFINIHFRICPFRKNALSYACDEYVALYYRQLFFFALLSHKDQHSTPIHEIGHMIDIGVREIPEKTNCVLEEYGIQTLYDNYRAKYIEELYIDIAPDNIDNLSRHCEGLPECKGFFINAGKYKYAHFTWWAIESHNPGYWGKLNNLYRFNYTLSSYLNENERMVYLSSLLIGFDMGYYFERFGLSMDNKNIFNRNKVTDFYKEKMEEAIKEGKIKSNVTKKFWYVDNAQYNFTFNNGKGCYKNTNNYSIRIIDININKKGQTILSLPKIDCEGHLGFEIIENDTVIGFSNTNEFIDNNNYPNNYKRKYKIAAYDRLLDYKESVNVYYEPIN